MLGRSANGIYWMLRYLERAENTARLLDAGVRLTLTRGTGEVSDEWRSILVTMGQEEAFAARYGETTGDAVTNFVLRDPDNSGSILNMIEGARANARTVRTAITREVWEAVNQCWMVFRELVQRPVQERSLGNVLAIIRRETQQVRGAIEGSMLRNEIFSFARLGTYLERADSTARILDVKYFLLLPSVTLVGSSLDNAQWETVLRSVSGDRAYRWLNAGRIEAGGIAEFLILDKRFPRSLAFCYGMLRGSMDYLAREHGRETKAHELLRDMNETLARAKISEILDIGLHEFTGSFLMKNKQLSAAIAEDYRFVA